MGVHGEYMTLFSARVTTPLSLLQCGRELYYDYEKPNEIILLNFKGEQVLYRAVKSKQLMPLYS